MLPLWSLSHSRPQAPMLSGIVLHGEGPWSSTSRLANSHAAGSMPKLRKTRNLARSGWMADPKVRRKSLCCNQLQVAVPGLCAFLEAA